jgi:hypothetical protein
LTAEEKKKWKSSSYDHYSVSLERLYNHDGSKFKLRFKFTCRFDPVNHIQYRDRMMTAQGATNLTRSIIQCEKKRGVQGNSPANAQQNLHGSVSKYTEIRHRAIVALRCAVSHRAFNMVDDPFYKQEVELLRPGTKVPSPKMVSRDVQTLYQMGSKRVVEYFSVRCIVDNLHATWVNFNRRNSLELFTS